MDAGAGSTSNKPAVELSQADTKNGEEDESTAFHGDGKLFQFVDNQWRERGSGDMRLNVAPSGGIMGSSIPDAVISLRKNHVWKSRPKLFWMWACTPILDHTMKHLWHDSSERVLLLRMLLSRYQAEQERGFGGNSFRPVLLLYQAQAHLLAKFHPADPVGCKLMETFGCALAVS